MHKQMIINEVYGCTQGLVKGAKLCLNPYFFSWLREVSWLAVDVLSPC